MFQALALAAVLMAAGLAHVHAVGNGDGIYVTDAQLLPDAEGDGWVLRADVQFELSNRLEEAINRGVTIYFALEFDLVRRRWYWWDDRAVQASQQIKLSYNALTREYRVSNGGLHQRYGRLEEALAAIGRVRNWRVVDRGALTPGERYDASVRMKLDVTQLPKPFQVNVLTNRDWNPPAEGKRFKFEVPER